MGVVVDYAYGRPSTRALIDAGVVGAARYLSWSDPKVINRSEYDTLKAAGIAVVPVWEWDARDWLSGADGARAHATEAVRQARILGHPAGAGIYGAADWDMTRDQWTGAARSYGQAFRQVIRDAGYRVGVYGPYDALTWCRDDLGYDLYWQAGMSTAWSARRNANPWPGVHLRQRRAVKIDGVACDINDILQADYGQGGEDVFTDREKAIVIEGTSIMARMAKGFNTLDDGRTVNQLYSRIEAVNNLVTQLHARPVVVAPQFDGEQLTTLGQAAGQRAAEAAVEAVTAAMADIADRLTALEARVDKLAAARRAAASSEQGVLES